MSHWVIGPRKYSTSKTYVPSVINTDKRHLTDSNEGHNWNKGGEVTQVIVAFLVIWKKIKHNYFVLVGICEQSSTKSEKPVILIENKFGTNNDASWIKEDEEEDKEKDLLLTL